MAIPGSGERTTTHRPPKGISRSEINDRRRTSETRPRRSGLDLPGDDGNERDPTRTTGIGLLDAMNEFLQQPQQPQDITAPTERTASRIRPPNDELNAGLFRPTRAPEEEEPEIIVPGNPDDLGERGRRRRTRDGVNSSPVLRRGLLGV